MLPFFDVKRGEESDEMRNLEIKLAKRTVKVVKSKMARPPNRSSKVVLKSSYFTKTKKNQKRNYKQRVVQKTKCKDSVQIKSDWAFVGDFQKTSFESAGVQPGSLSVTSLQEPEQLPGLDSKLVAAIRPKNRLRLAFAEQSKDTSTVWQDQYLSRLIEQFASNEEDRTKRVVGLDKHLLALLTMRTSVLPWDINFCKFGSVIVIRKHGDEEERNCYLDLEVYNENSNDNMPEDEAELVELCEINTSIRQSFRQQVCPGERPLYKYVKLQLEDMEVYTRVEMDGAGKEGEACLIRCFSEIETIGHWREKSSGSMVVEQYSKNVNLWHKWLCQAYLAEVEELRVGYICRDKEAEYNIIQVDKLSTHSAAKNLGFKITDNMDCLKQALRWVYAQEDGEYVCMKIPYKNQHKIYRVPEED